MSLMNFFAHENLLGQTSTDRADAKGYQCQKDYGSYYTEGVAENIFQGWLFSATVQIGPSNLKSYLSLEEVATRAVDGWMESPGHRENILNPTYDRVGTGVAISEDEEVYITQNFC